MRNYSTIRYKPGLSLQEGMLRHMRNWGACTWKRRTNSQRRLG